MAVLNDTAGLATSTGEPRSLALFERALASLFRADGNAMAAIEHAIARDPAFAGGHCLRAAALLLRDAAAPPALAASVAAIELHGNDRERRHAAAVRRWIEGDVAGAVGLYGEILRDHPRDRLALLAAHGLDFRLGHREMLRDRVAAVLPHWSEADVQYGYILGMHAFGLEENGDYDGALASAHGSLALVPDNAAAIHVIAHVLEMRGPPEKGIAWLRQTEPVWTANPGFRVHLAWHFALYQLDAHAAHAALATYDERIAPHLDDGTASLIDASALLWRLALCDAGSQKRWREVTQRWLSRDIINRAFELLHAVMALVASKHHAQARKVARRLREDASLRRRSSPEELALAELLVGAFIAFGRGDYDAVVESTSTIRSAAYRCGGSIAQCDVIHLTLLEAALRGRQQRLARTLAAERMLRKPASRLNRWLRERAWTLGNPRLATW